MRNSWQESRVIITATSIPLAILLCWFVYKRTLKKKSEKDKNIVNTEIEIEDSVQFDHEEDVVDQPSLIDAVSDGEMDEVQITHGEQVFENETLNNNEQNSDAVTLSTDCLNKTKVNAPDHYETPKQNSAIEIITMPEEAISKEMVTLPTTELEQSSTNTTQAEQKPTEHSKLLKTNEEEMVKKEIESKHLATELINDAETSGESLDAQCIIDDFNDFKDTVMEKLVDLKQSETIDTSIEEEVDATYLKSVSSSENNKPIIPDCSMSEEVTKSVGSDDPESSMNEMNAIAKEETVQLDEESKEDDYSDDFASYESSEHSSDVSKDEDSVTLLDVVDSHEESSSDEEKNLPSSGFHSNPMSLGETSSEVTSLESCSRVDTDKDSLEEGPIYNQKPRKTSDPTSNTNNNNNIDDSKLLRLRAKQNSSYGNECKSCGKSTGDSNIEHSKTNGWKNGGSDENESTKEDCMRKLKTKQKFVRPSSLSDSESTSVNDGDKRFEVFVEFPSERVGLLIGKQGRNINQLKQDSGADVFVHEAPYREDIQVLQICGTQGEVESCVARIKRRFNDISLASFDDPSSLMLSPRMTSPQHTPPISYPVPSISQLGLPDGVNIDVVVSAIADVDCIFVQQYTHPSFHALGNLERAMAVCYSEPSTPGLPNPAQVGLICAAHQLGMWYRVQIVQCYEETEELSIRFMDYGGYATLPAASVKQIRADFVNLPFQATECYLDNISSPGDDNSFCSDSVQRLQELLMQGRHQVRVTGYRTDGHPRVHLFKILNHKVVLINQEMATKGLATWVEPAPYQSTSN